MDPEGDSLDDAVAIPPELLEAVQMGGGRLALVVGAGCSLEPPTDLRLSSDYAVRAHDNLRSNGVLAEDCQDPADLSGIADAVRIANDGKQEALVRQLPLERFRQARPNLGHLIAVAMLSEGAIGSIVTINFDLALTNAVRVLGSKDISIIKGPREHDQIQAAANIVYLHRNVESEVEEWVLTSDALETAWKDGWEEVISIRILSSPCVAFVGLGSRAQVFEESISRISKALMGRASVFHVGPGQPEESEFAEALGLAPERHIPKTWGEFMIGLSSRLVEVQADEIIQICGERIHGAWDEAGVLNAAQDLTRRLCDLGLVHLGCLRGICFYGKEEYHALNEESTPWLVELILAVASMELSTHTIGEIRENGVVEFHQGGGRVYRGLLLHNRGVEQWLEIDQRARDWIKRSRLSVPPTAVIAGGLFGAPPDNIAAPASITGEEAPDNIANPGSVFNVIAARTLVESEATLEEVFG